ncbi:glycoside hydrolase family 2 protein [Microbacterium marmarense]|uniref:beta-mannosidase n=1 Tax=Microbacterium marmarense TaxID=3122051 RepID=A0ABU8LRZ0_9MICO
MTAITPLVNSLTRRTLSTGWDVRAAAGPTEVGTQRVAAAVPGVIHLDLLSAGLIPDPYVDENESKLSWIGLVDWTYETVLDITPNELASSQRHELVFEGLDTVASVTVNGVLIADVANQHRSYRFDVTNLLSVGGNSLVVAFRSPVRHANAQSVALGTRPRPYPLPFDAIRKSACSFGWDWGIATFASGIWRPVHLDSWSAVRLDAVDVHASPHGDGGTVTVVARLARTDDIAATLAVTVAGCTEIVEIAADAREAHITVEIADVDRWWPAGYGEQPLYDVNIELAVGSSVLDQTSRRVGFRTLRWNTEPDATGTPFQLIVNDQPVFVKGVNWIPDDAFPSRVDAGRYRRRLQQAKDAHLNLIRVWGGGIYESEDFYDACDELGLLTWQDFLFACAAYSEDEPIRSEVEAEARENVRRLAHRASLALLTGNNENLWGYEDWGWKERLDGKSWGSYYYYELFPTIIDELAAHVPYAPGSPFSPGGQHPNAEEHGSMHLWEQWNRRDWPTYRDHTPRFVAEFGWQGPPTWTTLTEAIHDEPLTPESPGMIVHQKAVDGNVKLATGLVGHYRVPEDMETWHWAMQLNQANAVTCALEWFRSHAPHTTGAVVWQLNDCWPVTSWAAIDGGGREKPLLFAIKNAFAPRNVSIQPRGDRLFATLTNDTATEWNGDVVVRRRRFDGKLLAEQSWSVGVPARGNITVDVSVALGEPKNAGGEVLTVEGMATRAFWFFTEARDSALTDPGLSASVTRINETAFDVTITATALVRDLTLLIDKIHPSARVDAGLVTLLPNESVVFRVTGLSNLDADAVLRPEVARSGNQLVAK